jgi:hypothetical protein
VLAYARDICPLCHRDCRPGSVDIYTHLFEDARHARDIRTRMAASPFASLLEPTTAAPAATVLKLR